MSSIGDFFIARVIASNEMLSKAPSMSKKVPMTNPFFAILFSIHLTTLWSAVSVDDPFLNPNCLSLESSDMFRSKSMYHLTHFSCIFWSIGVRVIVLNDFGLL